MSGWWRNWMRQVLMVNHKSCSHEHLLFSFWPPRLLLISSSDLLFYWTRLDSIRFGPNKKENKREGWRVSSACDHDDRTLKTTNDSDASKLLWLPARLETNTEIETEWHTITNTYTQSDWIPLFKCLLDQSPIMISFIHSHSLPWVIPSNKLLVIIITTICSFFGSQGSDHRWLHSSETSFTSFSL